MSFPRFGLLALVVVLVAIDAATVHYVTSEPNSEFVLGRTLLSGLFAGQLSLVGVAAVVIAAGWFATASVAALAVAAAAVAMTNWVGCSPAESVAIASVQMVLTLILARRAFITSAHGRKNAFNSRRDQFSTRDLLVWMTIIALIVASRHLLRFADQLPPGVVMMALVPGLFAGCVVYLASRLSTAIDRIAAVVLIAIVLANILDSRVAGLQFPAAFLWTLTQAVQLLIVTAIVIPLGELASDVKMQTVARGKQPAPRDNPAPQDYDFRLPT